MLLGCLLLGGAACGGQEISPPAAPGDSSAQRVAGATDALRALQRGIREGDKSAATRLAAPDATSRAAVGAMYDNARALDLSSLSLGFVDDGAGEPPARLGRYGLGAWTATVSVTWRVSGYDRGTSREDTRFSFVQVGSSTRIAEAGGGAAGTGSGDPGRVPLWLTGPLKVVRSKDALVLVSTKAGESARRYSALAARAVTDVRKVLTGWRARLVVEVPPSETALEQVLGADAGRYQAIAGVTTTVDGRQARSSPVHVFLNPHVFDGLGNKGAQVVLSHETTHVATDAPFASMPSWLLEGFADYVALDHAGVPLSTAASQIFTRVRKDGPPDALPSTGDLSPSAPGLGATYEEAWTVCRYIGAEYGEQRLIELYDRVDGGTELTTAFRDVLGVPQRAVVAGWRSNLAALVSGTATTRVPALPRER